jgi:hypothetical protein
VWAVQSAEFAEHSVIVASHNVAVLDVPDAVIGVTLHAAQASSSWR